MALIAEKQFQAGGEIEGVGYHVTWEPNRSFLLTMAARVMPAVRMTRTGKWSDRPAKYQAIQGALRDRVILLMREHSIEPFPKDVRLALGASFYLTPGHARGDLGNLEKAVEDMLQGALYENDRCIWARLPGRKVHSKVNRFMVKVEVLQGDTDGREHRALPEARG